MATAVTVAADIYLQQIHATRIRIHTCFKRAHELLVLREANLLKELLDIQSKYETGDKSQREEINGLKLSKKSLKKYMRDNDTLNEALAVINRKIEQLMEQPSGTKTIRFQWNTDFERDLKQVGEIITSNIPRSSSFPGYRNKSTPVITCCRHSENPSNTPGDLYCPYGLAIESQTGRIYIADSSNNRVQVFTANGQYCLMFNDKMNNPRGICTTNNTVFVSQLWGHCITLHNLDGAYLNTIGSIGTNEGQFCYPGGIAVSDTVGYIYVCDMYNHRLQIFNKRLKFHLSFSNTINYPKDVKLTKELIIVLDQRDPCIHLFNSTDYSPLSSIISRGANRQIGISSFFAIDKEINIIIADYRNHCIMVFSKAGDFLAQFGREGHSAGDFLKPTGIAIDNQHRIVVVSQNMNTALQIF